MKGSKIEALCHNAFVLWMPIKNVKNTESSIRH